MNTHPHGLFPRRPVAALAFLITALLATQAGLAQTVAPVASEAAKPPADRPVPVVTSTPAAPARQPEEVIELSPFVVTAEEDTGYAATSTLGGTRLRTNLRDIAASISVVTKELMDDLAVDDMSLLANYTVGTEVGGIGGNHSDTDVFNVSAGYVNDEVTRRNSSAPVIRVRGLSSGNSGGANRTRDYFLTDIPSDSYNIDRIDIQRGPNGMLYGLGSPSGVVNETVSKANVQRNKTKVSTRFDDYGSYRGSIDHNQVLIKDKLALRFSGLYTNQQYQIEEAFDKSRRIYGTLTYKPFRNTTLRVNSEGAEITANPPRTLPPFDWFSYWWDVGKPVWNAKTATASYLGTAPTDPNLGPVTRFLNEFSHRTTAPTLFIEDATTGEYGLSIPGNPTMAELAANRTSRNAANTGWVNGSMRGTANGRAYVQWTRTPLTTDPNRGFMRVPQITDPEIFDFYNHQLDGDARSRDARWHTFNVALEQRLGRNAGVEVAYDQQVVDNTFNDWAQFGLYAIKMDVTTTLVDGQPNPNFGRLFMSDGQPRTSRTVERQAFRATAYYELDTKRFLRPEGWLARILGHHTFTGNFTRQTSETLRFYGGPMMGLDYWADEQAANAGTSTVLSKISTGQRGINFLAYVSPNVSGASGPKNLGLQPVMGSILDNVPTSASVYNYPTPPANTTVPAQWNIKNYSIINPNRWDLSPSASQANHNREEYKSVSLVSQDYWLDDTLVTTLGVRRDWAKTYDAGGIKNDPDTGAAITDEATWGMQPRLDQVHDAFNYGVVLHAPDFVRRYLPKGVDVSLTYGRSDNFTPQLERFNVLGNSIEPTSGSTKEYGALLGLFNRKLMFRVTHYETGSLYATEGSFTNNPILSMDRTMFGLLDLMQQGRLLTYEDGVTSTEPARTAFLSFMRTPEAKAFYNTNVAGYFVDDNNQLQGARDGTINRVFATSDVVAKGWEGEVTANLTKNWRVTFNVAKQYTIKTNSGDDLDAMLDSWRPYLFDGAAGDMPTAEGSANRLRTTYQGWVATTNRVRGLNGSRSPELREWRFNFINNFSFTEGRLKGWNVGGAVRWQSKAAVGYPIVVIDGGGQYDVANPYWGPTETNVDGWIGYQRRIWNDRIAWKAQLNVRNIGVKDRLIPVTASPLGDYDTFRIGAGMTMALTNTFEF